MKISKAELFRICIPLLRPFETSFGSIRERTAIIIKLVSDSGIAGYGESSPLPELIYDPETTTVSMEFLCKQIPRLLGTPVANGRNITAGFLRSVYPVSCVGLESAYLDLLTRAQRIPLAQYFGVTALHVPAAESVSLRSTLEETIQEVGEYLVSGVKRIKLKIAPGRDRIVVDAVHRAFPELCFGLDANAAYTAQEIDHLARFTANRYISFVEQPFHADDYQSHTQLRKLGVKVCLDETVQSIESCKKSIAAGACDIVNIKPARIGSYAEARRIHDECFAAGVRMFGGGRLETGIAKSINATFYALHGFTDPSDITPPTKYLVADIINPPFVVAKGVYEISGSTGTGIILNDTAIWSFLKESVVFE